MESDRRSTAGRLKLRRADGVYYWVFNMPPIGELLEMGLSMRNKIGAALDKCDGCCLDDSADRWRVIDAVQDEITKHAPDFSKVCERARWLIASRNASTVPIFKRDLQVLLEALGEA